MRVGLDGRARIVYPTAKSLRYAVFSGSGFTTTSIPKTSSRAGQAQLVLGPGDVPQVAWLSTDQGAGCATGVDPAEGLYVGTEHGTTWTSLRLATGVGPFSLQVDPATGRIVVLQWAGGRMVFHSKDPGRPWVTTVVRGNYQFSGTPQLRIDPATESLMVAWIGDDGANVMNHP